MFITHGSLHLFTLLSPTERLLFSILPGTTISAIPPEPTVPGRRCRRA